MTFVQVDGEWFAKVGECLLTSGELMSPHISCGPSCEDGFPVRLPEDEAWDVADILYAMNNP